MSGNIDVAVIKHRRYFRSANAAALLREMATAIDEAGKADVRFSTVHLLYDYAGWIEWETPVPPEAEPATTKGDEQ